MLYAGDIGYYDANSCWYVVDRMKELIKYKANQVDNYNIHFKSCNYNRLSWTNIVTKCEYICMQVVDKGDINVPS